MKFRAWLVFAGIWAALVFYPVAHWVFAFDSGDGAVQGRWIANTIGAIDYAGSTAIHVNSGVAALALALVLGKRRTWPVQPKASSPAGSASTAAAWARQTTTPHFIGGVVCGLLIGILATPEAPSGATGRLYGGGLELLGKQALAILAVFAYIFAVTWLIAKALDLTMGIRLPTPTEAQGSTLPSTPKTLTRTAKTRPTLPAVTPSNCIIW